jgi:hypothetical protein
MQTTIQNAVDYANVAFTNSLVSAVYRLVQTAEVAYNDSGDIGADLTWVRGDAGVASLRDQAGADMLSLIVENGAGYTAASGTCSSR